MPMDYDDNVSDSLIMVCGPPALKESVSQLGEEMGLKNLYFFKESRKS